MLGKLKRAINQKANKQKPLKYRFDISVEKLDNLPGPVKKCRVVWSRGPKVQMTSIQDVFKGENARSGSAHDAACNAERPGRVCAGAVKFGEKLSQVATLYQDASGLDFEAKVHSRLALRPRLRPRCMVAPRVLPYGGRLGGQGARAGGTVDAALGAWSVMHRTPPPLADPRGARPPPRPLPQEYELKVQVPGTVGEGKMLTVGKAEIDLAMFAGPNRTEQPKLVPIMFKARPGVWG
jgi:hypothetical protein